MTKKILTTIAWVALVASSAYAGDAPKSDDHRVSDGVASSVVRMNHIVFSDAPSQTEEANDQPPTTEEPAGDETKSPSSAPSQCSCGSCVSCVTSRFTRHACS